MKVEAPKEPVRLGETITATIQAKYYFGAPVTHAKVKYKVTAHQLQQPGGIRRGDWDWFYGSGLLVVRRANTTGIPASATGACTGPCRCGGAATGEPPEVVLENEVPDRPPTAP